MLTAGFSVLSFLRYEKNIDLSNFRDFFLDNFVFVDFDNLLFRLRWLLSFRRWQTSVAVKQWTLLQTCMAW